VIELKAITLYHSRNFAQFEGFKTDSVSLSTEFRGYYNTGVYHNFLRALVKQHHLLQMQFCLVLSCSIISGGFSGPRQTYFISSIYPRDIVLNLKLLAGFFDLGSSVQKHFDRITLLLSIPELLSVSYQTARIRTKCLPFPFQGYTDPY
jgi:hypothetical protein